MEELGISFDESQLNVGAEYYLYISDFESHGGGTSCYFWFQSNKELLNSIRNHMDFWDWKKGYDNAKICLKEIIGDTAVELSGALVSKLNKFMIENANIIIIDYGKFENLCTSDDYKEIRGEFRETQEQDDDCEDEEQEDDYDNADGLDMERSIEEEEMDAFCEYRANIPS